MNVRAEIDEIRAIGNERKRNVAVIGRWSQLDSRNVTSSTFFLSALPIYTHWREEHSRIFSCQKEHVTINSTNDLLAINVH